LAQISSTRDFAVLGAFSFSTHAKDHISVFAISGCIARSHWTHQVRRIERHGQCAVDWHRSTANRHCGIGDIKETRILAKYDVARTVSYDKIANVDPMDKNIVDARKQAPGFSDALSASHEVIYQMADGTYRKVKASNGHFA
jgi:hypothetical protein